MSTSPVSSPMNHFTDLEDPRIDRNKRHLLFDLIAIALCGVICGADTWVAIEQFGKAKEPWLRRFLLLPNGIPSHDTFGRVFARIRPEAFQQCFSDWMQAVADIVDAEIIPIDGKTLRSSYDRRSNKAAIHMVSAWASRNRLVLGQCQTEADSNEITAIPELLDLLALKGCIVTIDAMGCQKEIAQQIIDQEADYVLALKANHGKLFAAAQELFADVHDPDFRGQLPVDYHETDEISHGRHEIRRYWLWDPEYLHKVLPPRYEIDDQDTRYRNGSFEKEPICKTRVLNADRSQMCFLTCSMAISRENSSEKEFDVVEE